MKNKLMYPVEMLAFYGPADKIATKAVIGIVPRKGAAFKSFTNGAGISATSVGIL